MSELKLGLDQRWLPVSLPREVPNRNPSDPLSKPKAHQKLYEKTAKLAEETLSIGIHTINVGNKNGEVHAKEAWTWMHREKLSTLQTCQEFKNFLDMHPKGIVELLTENAAAAFRHDFARAQLGDDSFCKTNAVWLATNGVFTIYEPARTWQMAKEPVMIPAVTWDTLFITETTGPWLPQIVDRRGKCDNWAQKVAISVIVSWEAGSAKQKDANDIKPGDRESWTLWEKSNLEKLTNWGEVTKFFDHKGDSGRDRGWKVQNLMERDTKTALQHDMVKMALDETNSQGWQEIDTAKYMRYLLMAGVTPEIYEAVRTDNVNHLGCVG